MLTWLLENFKWHLWLTPHVHWPALVWALGCFSPGSDTGPGPSLPAGSKQEGSPEDARGPSLTISEGWGPPLLLTRTPPLQNPGGSPNPQKWARLYPVLQEPRQPGVPWVSPRGGICFINAMLRYSNSAVHSRATPKVISPT